MTRQNNPTGATPRSENTGFPRQHLVAAGACACALILGLVLWPTSEVEATRKAIPVELPLAAPTEIPEEPQASAAENWVDVQVKPGDNLSLLFARAGLTDSAPSVRVACAEALVRRELDDTAKSARATLFAHKPFDIATDRQRFHVTDRGIVLVTRDMLTGHGKADLTLADSAA